MFKLTLAERIAYIVFYLVLAAITFDGRLYVIADASIVFFIIITGLLLASSAVGYVAESKSRSRVSFFLLSLFFSPIFMGLIVAIMAKPHTNSSSQ